MLHLTKAQFAKAWDTLIDDWFQKNSFYTFNLIDRF